MSKFIGFVVLSLSALFFTGCNTMEGMGEDVERGGEEIQEQAN